MGFHNWYGHLSTEVSLDHTVYSNNQWRFRTIFSLYSTDGAYTWVSVYQLHQSFDICCYNPNIDGRSARERILSCGKCCVFSGNLWQWQHRSVSKRTGKLGTVQVLVRREAESKFKPQCAVWHVGPISL